MIESFHPTAESKDTDDDSAETKKDSKPSVDKKKLGTFTAKNVIEAPNIHRPREEAKPSLWEKLVQDAGKKPKEEKVLEKTEPVEPKGEAAKEEKAEAMKPVAENREDDEAAIEKLAAVEQQEVVRRIAEARAMEARGQSPENEEDEAETVEDAASLALMASLQRKLTESPEEPVEQVLDEAEAETMERIGVEEEPGGDAEAAVTGAEDSGEPTAEAEDATDDEADSSAQTAEAADGKSEPVDVAEGEIPLHDPAVEDEDASTIIIPRGGSGGSGTPPPGSSGGGGAGGTGGTGGRGGGGSGGGTGGGGSMPPRTPGGSAMPPIGGAGAYGSAARGASFNAAPGAAPGVSLEDLQVIVHRQERAAIAQGLLIGGIIGYLIGRRRGRIKTEKRLLPVQKKLEQQVETLQAAVLERDRKVRMAAAEKARAMATQEARDRFARRLAFEDEARSKAAARREQKEKAKAKTAAPEPLQLGRMVVEAPAAAATGISVARHIETGVETPKITAMPDKKVEDYTAPELKRAAERIRVDGTTVKEMWDRGQLSERAVERVVAEFIEGHSVRAALTKELLKEPARFEVDPKLRDTVGRQTRTGGGTSGGSGGGGMPPVAKAGAAMLLRTLGSGDTAEPSDRGRDAAAASEQKQPSMFKRVREEPKTQMAVAGAGIVAALLLAAVFIFG